VSAIKFIDVRKGMVLLMDDGQLYQCLDRDLNTPGNWRAILQLKLKNLKTESITMQRVRPDDKTELAFLDTRPMQYLYKEGKDYIFMDKESYEQIPLSEDLVGEQMGYLREGDDAKVTVYEGKPLSVELNATVDLKVVETEPALKGATAKAQLKPAILETGLKVSVPPFVAVGDVLQIDTRTGEYLRRSGE
jgi:elongation factor P